MVLPNPRGSTSYGQAFTSACTGDWGGGDADDIVACCDDLIERSVVDGGRMFLSGGSYGGFMATWLVGHTDRFRAATASAAVIDQTSMALTTEITEFDISTWRPVVRWHETSFSQLTYLPDVTAPMLVIHWEGDLRVPIGQGEGLYSGLRLLGKELELVRHPGGPHPAHPSQAVDYDERILAWNRRHDVRRGAKKRAASG